MKQARPSTLYFGIACGLALASCSLPEKAPLEPAVPAVIDSRRPIERLRSALPKRVELGLGFGIAGVVVDSAGSDLLVSGKRSLEPPKPLMEKDVVEVGGLTEIFTAVLFELATEEKKIELATPLEKYFPVLRGKPLGKRTLESLLYSQRFPTANDVQLVGSDGGRSSFDRMVSEGETLLPGSEPMVVGAVLEKIYRRPFSEIFQSRIASPLRLKKTGLARARRSRSKSDGLAVGYSVGGEPQGYAFSEAGPSGPLVGLKVQIADLRPILTAFLRPPSDRLGRAIQKVLAKRIDGEKDKVSAFFHFSAQTLGFSSALILDREKKMGAFIVSNQRMSVDGLAAYVAGAVPADLWVARIEAGRKKEEEKEKISPQGRYSIERAHSSPGDILPASLDISEVAARWIMRLPSGGGTAFLFPGAEAGEWFALTENEIKFRLTFTQEEKGSRKVTELRLEDLIASAKSSAKYLRHDAASETYPAYEN